VAQEGLMDSGLPTLSDGRFTLRPWRANDLDDLAPAVRDPDVLRWCISIPDPYGDEDGRAFLAARTTGWKEDGEAYFAACDTSSGRLVGAAGLDVDVGTGVGEAGYWIGRKERRRGAAAAALRLLATWGFGDLGLARISAHIHIDNAPSQRTVRSVGFVREGMLRSYRADQRGVRGDYVIYSLLPDDAHR